MDFTPKRRRVTKQEINTSNIYSHDLQLYKESPEGQLTLEEFQEIAVERLKVLQLVENIAAQCLPTINECRALLEKSLKKEGYTHYVKLLYGTGCSSQTDEDIEARKRDHISHFILRLAYGQREDLRSWFLIHELELFKWRFSLLKKEGITHLMSIYDFDYKPVSEDEKTKYLENLMSSTAKDIDIHDTIIYKVPFEDVLDLIQDRKIFIKRGIAYLPLTELTSVFITIFKQNLSDELLNIPQYISKIKQDDRLLSFLKALPNCFSGMTRVVWNDENTPISMIHDLSKTSYPLCMRTLHEALTTKHHLRNTGRLTYGMFLKGIGVSLEDALTFWKEEFSKGKEKDRFDKEHRYTIRHYFGKEGKKTNYTPYGCSKIINTVVGEGEYHGCPYKYMDNNSLKKKLTDCGISEQYSTEILDFSKKGEYLQACRKYFEATHKRKPERIFVHPNQYFMESRAIHNESESSDPQSSQSQASAQNYSQETQKIFTPTTKPKVEKIEKASASKKTVDKKELNIEQLLNDDDLDDFSELF